ncbi:hypothetical protein ACFQZT_01000 [Paenibacillus sp. GCM10027628]|uniref:hypothetical protein n=1 Tax=Paenibacillus sp. GCM10027628 TaxID=3273413 RepID=UPI00363014F4
MKSFALGNRDNLHLPFKISSIGYNQQQDQVQSVTIQCYEVMIGTIGKGIVRIRGEEPFVLHPEQAVIIRPGSVYETQAVEDGWESAVLRFVCSPTMLPQFRLRLHQPMAILGTSWM